MRQTQIKNILKDFEKRISFLEIIITKETKLIQEKKPLLVKVKDSQIESVSQLQKDTPQENYNKSVEAKGLPKKTEDEVSTTKTSLDGKSPVDTKKFETKIKHPKAITKIENEN